MESTATFRFSCLSPPPLVHLDSTRGSIKATRQSSHQNERNYCITSVCSVLEVSGIILLFSVSSSQPHLPLHDIKKIILPTSGVVKLPTEDQEVKIFAMLNHEVLSESSNLPLQHQSRCRRSTRDWETSQSEDKCVFAVRAS